MRPVRHNSTHPISYGKKLRVARTYHNPMKMYKYKGKIYIATSKSEVLRRLKISPKWQEEKKITILITSENKK